MKKHIFWHVIFKNKIEVFYSIIFVFIQTVLSRRSQSQMALETLDNDNCFDLNTYSDCETDNNERSYKAKYKKHKSRSQGRLVQQITVETCTADSDEDSNTLRPTDLQTIFVWLF